MTQAASGASSGDCRPFLPRAAGPHQGPPREPPSFCLFPSRCGGAIASSPKELENRRGGPCGGIHACPCIRAYRAFCCCPWGPHDPSQAPPQTGEEALQGPPPRVSSHSTREDRPWGAGGPPGPPGAPRPRPGAAPCHPATAGAVASWAAAGPSPWNASGGACAAAAAAACTATDTAVASLGAVEAAASVPRIFLLLLATGMAGRRGAQGTGAACLA
ncbi:formin-like protein 18 [Cyclospora cayetanensis]|uniref:Formin-like protein 18 n=1 Tax=Cyclospora cayetanensis TaxID=88456 RepID=A0A6P6RRN6_9EIME|nr:formin-like protein 18 [Cyclospora cayetanensis]